MRKMKKFMTYVITALMILNTLASNAMIANASEMMEETVVTHENVETASDDSASQSEEEQASDIFDEVVVENEELSSGSNSDEEELLLDSNSDEEELLSDSNSDDAETAMLEDVSASSEEESDVPESEEIIVTYKVNDDAYGYIEGEKEIFSLEDEIVFQGAKAIANDGYEFVDWTNADGNQVSTESIFIPTEKVTAEYIANFKEVIKEEVLNPEDVKKDSFPEIDFGKYHLDEMTVEIFAPEGAFPKGTTVSVKSIPKHIAETMVEPVIKDGECLADVKAVDITFYDQEQKEIQPLAAINVTFSNANLEGDNFALYHECNHNSLEKITEFTDADGVSVAVDSFSDYVVVSTRAANVTVTFNKNNGTGNAPNQVTVQKNTSITLPNYTGSRNGYQFMGWSKSAKVNQQNQYTGDNVIFPVGSEYFVTKNTTLYAVWGKTGGTNAQFFIRNDGNIPHEPQNHDSAEYSSAIDISGAIKVASFYANQNGVDDQLNKKPSDQQIKAVWPSFDPETQFVRWYVIKPEATWHVDGVILNKAMVDLTYKPNGAGVNNVPNGSQWEKDSVATVSGTEPNREGYTFTGWNTKEDGTGTAYEKGDTFTITQNTTLYAQWTGNRVSYTVEHYQQQLDGKYPDTPTDTENNSGNVGSEVTPPVKKYSGFTAPNPYSITLQVDSEKNVVKYYYTRNQYQLTIQPNGGTYDGKTDNTSVQLLFGETYAVADAEPLENQRQVFNGFKKTKGDSATFDQSTKVFTMGAEDAVLTAQWKNYYKVTYRNGDSSVEDTTKYYFEEEFVIVEPQGLALDTLKQKEVHRFTGWKLQDAEGEELYNAGDGLSMPAKDIVFEAQFDPVYMTIEIYLQNGNSLVDDSVEKYTKRTPDIKEPAPAEGTEVTAESLQDKFEDEAYHFNEDISEGITVSYAEGASNVVKLYYDLEIKTITLDKNLDETVTYSVPGYSDIDAYYKAQFVKYNKTNGTLQYTKKSTPFKIPMGEAVGYDFRGWKENGNWAVDYFKENAEDILITPENRFEDRTFVAQWARNIETKLYILNPGLSEDTKKEMYNKEKHLSTSAITSYSSSLFTKAIGTAIIKGLVTDQYISVKSDAYDQKLDTKYVDNYKIAPVAGGPEYDSATDMLTMEFDGYIYKAKAGDIAWYVVKKERDHWHVDGNARWQDPVPVDRKIIYVARVDGVEQSDFLDKKEEIVPFATDLSTISSPVPKNDVSNLYLEQWSWSEDGTTSKDFHNVVKGTMPNKNITVYVDYRTKTAITLKAADITKVYDKTDAVKNDMAELTAGALKAGDSFIVVTKIIGSVRNVADDGSDKHVIDTYKIIDNSNNDVTEQYAVSRLPGNVTITPAPLTIVTNSASKVYDGTPLTADGTLSGLIDDETATFTTNGSQTAVGVSANGYAILYNGTAVQSNYYIASETIGVLTITAAPVTPPGPGPTPGPTPPTPGPTPPTPEPTPTPTVTIADAPVALAAPDVLGARRGIGTDGSAVLGANRNQAVLGARRGAATGDEGAMAMYMFFMSVSASSAGIYAFAKKRRNHAE